MRPTAFDTPIMVTKSFLPPHEEYTKEIERIWSNHWLTNNGVIHQEFEQKLGQYLEAPNISLLTNGHLALEAAIKALDIKGEVITTPFTFASTSHAIANTGLKPVFCDVDELNLNINPRLIEELITENTSAIMPVHVFGNPCNIEAIDELAKKHQLKVIYDAAHAFGVEYAGKSISKYGDISMFSLHATKVFHSIEGGLLTFNDPLIKRKVELYKNFGITGPDTIEMTGINAKMNEFQAAMGVINLRYIDTHIAHRKNITRVYKQGLSIVKGVKFIEPNQDVKHNYAYMPILINPAEFGMHRDELHERLKGYNVFTRKYFYPLLNEIVCYKEDSLATTPIAAQAAERVLTLPIYSTLQLEEVEQICEIIRFIAEVREQSGV